MTDHDEWLAQTREDIIDPGLPICDPHHHLWNSPDRHYLLEELFQDLREGHNIVQTVFVESSSAIREALFQKMEPVEETRFIHEITSRKATRKYGLTAVAAGIVGFANLKLGTDVIPVLEAQIAASDRFRGIRQICSWDINSDIIRSISPPNLLMDNQFRKGFACLKRYRLTFETFIYHPQLNELIDLARTFPEVPIILDHVGGPLGIGPYAGKRDEVFREWKNSIGILATCPNVFIKLGGLGMPICGFNWSKQATPPKSAELAKDMEPFYLWCIDKFGVERCMFESNFPVDRTSYSYNILWNAFKRICTGFSAGECAFLFSKTAIKVYRLKGS